MQVQFKFAFKNVFHYVLVRGVRDGQHNLYVAVSDGEHTGWGETSPGTSEGASTAEEAQQHLDLFKNQTDLTNIHSVYDAALKAVAPCFSRLR